MIKMLKQFFTIAIVFTTLSFLSNFVSCSFRKSDGIDSQTGVYHIVKPKQTLYRIALTYQVPLETVRRINEIEDPSKIEVGQKIFIPGAEEVLQVAIFKPSLEAFSFLPLKGPITSRFGARRGRNYHTGIDISANLKDPVHSVLPGEVIFSGVMSRYGNTVRIRHDKGFESLYAHNYRNLVKVGQRVSKGQKIALAGKSGNASGYHLHFEIRKNDIPVDPISYLNH